MSLAGNAVAVRRPLLGSIPHMIRAQVKAGVIGYRRQPSFLIFSLVLPLGFYALFGTIFGNQKIGAASVYAYLLGSYGAYAVSSIMIFNIGISIAQERGRKLDLLQRAMPLPGWVAILAKVVVSLGLACLTLILLFTYAAIFGHVRLQADRWVLLFIVLVLGGLPILGLGLTIGYGSSATAAPALANLIGLPMFFLSGLLIPLTIMPSWIQKIGVFLPTYHYGQLAWNSVGAGQEEPWKSILWLAGWAVVLFGIAMWAYRREARRKFS